MGQASHRSNPINGKEVNAARTLHGNMGKGAPPGKEAALANAGREGEKSKLFSLPLVFRQPRSRRPIHNRKPSKESLRQIGVVPDLHDDTGSDRRHALSCHHRSIQAEGSLKPDRTRCIQQTVHVDAG